MGLKGGPGQIGLGESADHIGNQFPQLRGTQEMICVAGAIQHDEGTADIRGRQPSLIDFAGQIAAFAALPLLTAAFGDGIGRIGTAGFEE